LNLDAVIAVFGQGAILAAILLVVGAFIIGYLLGTIDQSEKLVLGFATANRNFAAATVVATQSFSDPAVLVMTVVISTLAMVLLIPAATAIGRLKADEGDGTTREETQKIG
jgi:BASS family bile acid:Na+ symporter